MPAPKLTKDARGDYRTADGRWHVEKIGGGYRLWRIYRVHVTDVGTFDNLADVRSFLAEQVSE